VKPEMEKAVSLIKSAQLRTSKIHNTVLGTYILKKRGSSLLELEIRRKKFQERKFKTPN
jgi:hypothetical protein